MQHEVCRWPDTQRTLQFCCGLHLLGLVESFSFRISQWHLGEVSQRCASFPQLQLSLAATRFEISYIEQGVTKT